MAADVRETARELALGLLMQQWQPRHLSPSQAESIDVLTHLCLQEAITLREEGQPLLSLELLQAAEARGLQDPWLLDNQARALVNLERRQSAWLLWQRLIEHGEQEIAQTAQTMAALQEESLLNALRAICQRDHWQSRHLEGSEHQSLMEKILLEIIDSREHGHPHLSLDLASEALAQGWESPWLLDNKARALVNLDRKAEAVAIWQDLRDHRDPEVSASAAAMLDLYQGRVEQQQLLERCATLERKGDPEQAEALLIEALIRSPDAEPLREKLGKLLTTRDDAHEHDDPTLKRNAVQLAIHARILDALEARLIRSRQHDTAAIAPNP
jgi:hypothetical protein